MADLTSRYKNRELRDLSMQACINAIDKAYVSFPENYHKGAFTNFFDIQGGTQPPKSAFRYSPENNYVRFLQIRDFSSDTTPTFIPVSSKNKLCVEGDILLGRYGASVGKILTGKSGAYNVACAKVILLDNTIIDKDYLFYLLHSPNIQNRVRGISRSAQGGFNKGDLSKIEIVIPKLNFQKKIVLVLRMIDNFLVDNLPLKYGFESDDFLASLINAFDKQLRVVKEIEKVSLELDNQQTYLQQLRQAILQEAVQGKLTQRHKDDEPASKLLERIKAEKQQLIAAGKLKKEKPLPPITADEIPFELPEGWVWCRLGDLIQSVNNGLYKPESFYKPTGTISLRMYNIQNGEIDFNNVKRVLLNDDEKILYKLEEDDILINRVNSAELVGKSAIINRYDEDLVYESMNMRVRLFFKNNLAKYVNLYLRTEAVKDYFTVNLKQAISQASINQTQLRNLLIPLPPVSEQQSILTKVQQLMQMTNHLEQQVQQSQTQAQQLLQAVLKEAFSPKEKLYEENEMITMAAEE